MFFGTESEVENEMNSVKILVALCLISVISVNLSTAASIGETSKCTRNFECLNGGTCGQGRKFTGTRCETELITSTIWSTTTELKQCDDYCSNSPCCRCEKIINEYFCVCGTLRPGATGCAYGSCSTNPCQAGELCTDLFGDGRSYMCYIDLSPTSLTTTSANTCDESCSSSACCKCDYANDGPQCMCADLLPGSTGCWFGSCSNNTCPNGGRCADLFGDGRSYVCNYDLSTTPITTPANTCDESCLSDPCCKCDYANDGPQCMCADLLPGSTSCQFGSCSSNTCPDGERCVDLFGDGRSYVCIYEMTTTISSTTTDLNHCEDYCENSPCCKCSKQNNDYSCVCASLRPGVRGCWFGSCSSSLCPDGGKCIDMFGDGRSYVCDYGSNSTDLFNIEFTTDVSSTSITPASNNDCDGNCLNDPCCKCYYFSDGPQCACAGLMPGSTGCWFGSCSSNPCPNGGRCVDMFGDGRSYFCINEYSTEVSAVETSPTPANNCSESCYNSACCRCDLYKEGPTCVCAEPAQGSIGCKFGCCSSNPCLDGESCVDLFGDGQSYGCEKGLTTDNSTIDPSPTSANTCEESCIKSACCTCKHFNNGPQCACVAPMIGATGCEFGPCSGNPCPSDARCIDLFGDGRSHVCQTVNNDVVPTTVATPKPASDKTCDQSCTEDACCRCDHSNEGAGPNCICVPPMVGASACMFGSCSSNPCPDGGRCIDMFGDGLSYFCLNEHDQTTNSDQKINMEN